MSYFFFKFIAPFYDVAWKSVKNLSEQGITENSDWVNPGEL